MARAPKHARRAETGIPLSRAVALSIDWPKFAANMTKLVVVGFATSYGQTEHAGEAIASLIEAAGSISVTAPPGERGWSLFCLGFAWAFDELRSRGQLNDVGVEAAVREALEKAKVLVDQSEQIIPTSFLEHPTTLPLYRVVRDTFIERKGAFRPADGEADGVLRARFDAAFDRAIFLLWSQAPDQYQPLAAALSAPGSTAHAFRLEWDAYRKSLIYEFEVKPVFGQEESRISLSQLYVPLRGVSPDATDISPRVSRGPEPIATKRKPFEVALLDDELGAWATSGPARYELKLIGGGPGSGKSTTVKALARRLAERDDCRPLFIPLAHIDPANTDLRDAINGYFTRRTASPFRQPPIARPVAEEGSSLVLIFDGLDELARPGAASDEVARDFMLRLSQLASELSGGRSSRLRVVVTGRMPSFQTARRYAVAANAKSYEVVGFLPIEKPEAGYEFLAIEEPEVALSNAERKLLKLDQRMSWWARYAAAVGAPEDPPDALQGQAFESLTQEPLLCYLLALSGYLTEQITTSNVNQNTIYRKLIDEVWRRGWGEGPGNERREGPGKFLTLEGFNRLMETIALSGWQGGDTRVCSENRFLAAAKALRTERHWEEFKRDNGPDITNLAINFYFKTSETEGRGFEFTHKSFGDYLAARALLTMAFDIATLVGQRTEAALREWFDITSSGRLSHELVYYITNELQLLFNDCGGAERIRALQLSFQELCSDVLRDGLPANGNADQPWRIAEMRQRNAEIMLWAVLHGCVTALADRGGDVKLEVKWPHEFALADLLRRVCSQSDLSASTPIYISGPGMGHLDLSQADPTLSCFSYLVAPKANCISCVITGVNMQNADFRGANLNGAVIRFCNLKGANLTQADLSYAWLRCVVLDEANLEDADLQHTKLEDLSLEGTALRGTSFKEAYLHRCRTELGEIQVADLQSRGAEI